MQNRGLSLLNSGNQQKLSFEKSDNTKSDDMGFYDKLAEQSGNTGE